MVHLGQFNCVSSSSESQPSVQWFRDRPRQQGVHSSDRPIVNKVASGSEIGLVNRVSIVQIGLVNRMSSDQLGLVNRAFTVQTGLVNR